MNNDLKDHTAVAAARRRLVRGVFAAPAALTLCSGSVYAAASNRQCLAKAVANPIDGTTADPTTLLRVRVHRLTSGSKSSTWVWGDDLKVLQASHTPVPFLSESQWLCLTSNMSAFTAKKVEVSVPTKGTAIPQPVPGQYVAVTVKADGQIVGVQGIENGGVLMGESCWASVIVLA